MLAATRWCERRARHARAPPCGRVAGGGASGSAFSAPRA